MCSEWTRAVNQYHKQPTYSKTADIVVVFAGSGRREVDYIYSLVAMTTIRENPTPYGLMIQTACKTAKRLPACAKMSSVN